MLVWGDTGPQSIYALQRRIGRKTVPKRLLSEAPVILYAYDLLEWNGVDIRQSSLAERRVTLEKVLNTLPTGTPVKLSPTVPFDTWSALSNIRSSARRASAEGLMLKRRDSSYLTGRRKGDWWKWKLDPLTIDAVMIYAQSGQGRCANPFTDFTFVLWKGNELIPFTKACSGLTDEEFRKITARVNKNTQQRFGPVRSVTPEHVFEIAFEGIGISPRHKSGVALRFPRMSRWRHDKPIHEANSLEDLNEILASYGWCATTLCPRSPRDTTADGHCWKKSGSTSNSPPPNRFHDDWNHDTP